MRTTFNRSLLAAASSCHRSASSAAAAAGAAHVMHKPFDEVPGPPGRGWPFFGHSLEMVRKPHGIARMWLNVLELKKKHAPDATLLRLYTPSTKSESINGWTVFLFDPDDAETLYRNDNKYPYRGPQMAWMQTIRRRMPEIFGDTMGLATEDFEMWHDLRSKVQQDMLRPKSALHYFDQMSQVSDDFVDHIRDKGLQMEDFLSGCNAFSFESIGIAALDARLGALGKAPPPEDSKRTVDAAMEFFSLFAKMTVSFPTYKYLPSPRWSKEFRRAEDSHRQFCELVMRRVQDVRDRTASIPDADKASSRSDMSVLEKLIVKHGINSPIPTVMALDMMLGGIDTTGNSLAFMTYLLAKNPEQQEKVRADVLEHAGEARGGISPQSLNKMKMVDATIKETMRVFPLVTWNTRVLDHDVVLSGYNIPAGTSIAASGYLTNMDERLYMSPGSFLPERWLRGGSSSDRIHPFASLPFSHGSRSCIGRRFAMLELQLVLCKLLQNFSIEWAGSPDEEVNAVLKLVSTPDKPVKIRFNEL